MTFSLKVILALASFISSLLSSLFNISLDFCAESGDVPADPGGFLLEPFLRSSGLDGVCAPLLGPGLPATICSEKSSCN